MKFLVLTTLLAISMFEGTVNAQVASPPSTPIGVCYVYVNGSCHASAAIPAKTWFPDSLASANNSASRCLQRAMEYKLFCNDIAPQTSPPPAPGTYGSDVVTIFQVAGQNQIGASTYSDGKVYLNDGVSSWIRFVSY